MKKKSRKKKTEKKKKINEKKMKMLMKDINNNKWSRFLFLFPIVRAGCTRRISLISSRRDKKTSISCKKR